MLAVRAYDQGLNPLRFRILGARVQAAGVQALPGPQITWLSKDLYNYNTSIVGKALLIGSCQTSRIPTTASVT